MMYDDCHLYPDKHTEADHLHDLGECLPRNFEGSWNYCEYGHYEEGDSPYHPCFNLIEFRENECE